MAYSYWLQNAMGAGHILIDMGSAKDQQTRDATDRLVAALGKGRHVQIVGNARVTVRLPPKKAASVLTDFPEIVPGAAGYCWCSHGWAPITAPVA